MWAVAEGESWVKKEFFLMGKISACLYADRNAAVKKVTDKETEGRFPESIFLIG